MTFSLFQAHLAFHSVFPYLKLMPPYCEQSPEDWSSSEAVNIKPGDVIFVLDPIFSPWGNKTQGIGVSEGDKFRVAQVLLPFKQDSGFPMSIALSADSYEMQFVETILCVKADAARMAGHGFYYLHIRPKKELSAAQIGQIADLHKYGSSGSRTATPRQLPDPAYAFFTALDIALEPTFAKNPMDIEMLAFYLYSDYDSAPAGRAPNISDTFIPVKRTDAPPPARTPAASSTTTTKPSNTSNSAADYGNQSLMALLSDDWVPGGKVEQKPAPIPASSGPPATSPPAAPAPPAPSSKPAASSQDSVKGMAAEIASLVDGLSMNNASEPQSEKSSKVQMAPSPGMKVAPPPPPPGVSTARALHPPNHPLRKKGEKDNGESGATPAPTTPQPTIPQASVPGVPGPIPMYGAKDGSEKKQTTQSEKKVTLEALLNSGGALPVEAPKEGPSFIFGDSAAKSSGPSDLAKSAFPSSAGPGTDAKDDDANPLGLELKPLDSAKSEAEPELEPTPVVAEPEPEPTPVVAEPEPEPTPVVAEPEPTPAPEPVALVVTPEKKEEPIAASIAASIATEPSAVSTPPSPSPAPRSAVSSASDIFGSADSSNPFNDEPLFGAPTASAPVAPAAAEPAPAVEQAPAPAAEQEPAPAAEQEPAPATEQAPAPAAEQAPAPAPEQAPAPAAEPAPVAASSAPNIVSSVDSIGISPPSMSQSGSYQSVKEPTPAGVSGLIAKLEQQAQRATVRLEQKLDEQQLRMHSDMMQNVSKLTAKENQSQNNVLSLRTVLSRRLTSAGEDLKEQLKDVSEKGCETIKDSSTSTSASINEMATSLSGEVLQAFDDLGSSTVGLASSYGEKAESEQQNRLVEVSEVLHSLQSKLEGISRQHFKVIQGHYDLVERRLQQLNEHSVAELNDSSQRLKSELLLHKEDCVNRLNALSDELADTIHESLALCGLSINSHAESLATSDFIPKLMSFKQGHSSSAQRLREQYKEEVEKAATIKLAELRPVLMTNREKIESVVQKANGLKSSVEVGQKEVFEGMLASLHQYVEEKLTEARAIADASMEELTRIEKNVFALSDAAGIEADPELAEAKVQVLSKLQDIGTHLQEKVNDSLRRQIAGLEDKSRMLQEELISSMEGDAYGVRKAAEANVQKIKQTIEATYAKIAALQNQYLQ